MHGLVLDNTYLNEKGTPGFAYDEVTQRPMVNGRRVLGLTDVLKFCGIMEGQMWGSDHDLWMGQCRHAAVELWVKGTLDLSTVHPEIMPSIEAFLDFQQHTGFRPTHSEYKVWNPIYQVATRIDLMGELPDGVEVIIELKSGACAKPTAIQTAGQDSLLGAQRTRQRFGLSIPKTGKPKVVPYTDRDDYSIWISAMNIAIWKVKKLGVKIRD
jgi:hypothetical protein